MAVGRSEQTFMKHDTMERLAEGQTSIAIISLLKNGGRACIIDMHAGDGEGVSVPQMGLFGTPHGLSTPEVALLCAGLLRDARETIHTTVFLCERSANARRGLEQISENYDVQILANHNLLKVWRHDWALVFSDPNGPSDQGADVMAQIAQEIPKADFIINVNESVMPRMEGWRKPSLVSHRNEYKWMMDANAWCRLLKRKSALRARYSYGRGNRGMLGRIWLVSDYPQRCPRDFERFDFNDKQGAA